MEHWPSLQPTHGIPTPPESPRKRRNILRESEDTDGELTIENYLCRSDPYRSTTLEDPWPYPTISTVASSEVTEAVEDHREEICRILSDHGFPSNFHLRVESITKPNYPRGDFPVTLLRVVFVHTPPISVPSRLGPAKDQISDLLAQKGIPLDVEIVFSDLCFQPSLFAVDRRDPAAAVYEAAEFEIVNYIHSVLSRKWRLIPLFNVGRTKSKTTPAIVVLVKPFTVANWSELIRMKLPTNILASVGLRPSSSLLRRRLQL